MMVKDALNYVRQHAKQWQPNFKWLDDLDEVAHTINRPHEDYPLRVPITEELIRNFCEETNRFTVGLPHFNAFAIKSLHSTLFHGDGMNHNRIKAGGWRRYDVQVGNHVAPSYIMVDALMEEIMPVGIHDDLEDWYALFESVHPFEDGNGRVGGIVVASLSYLKHGRYLTPTQ